MSFTFTDLQTEVKRRATVNQSGGYFDTAVKNILNTSLYRLAREAQWRVLRRKTTFATEAKQTNSSTSSASTVVATNGQSSFTGTNMSLITNGIRVGRRIQISGSSRKFIISTITGENAFTTNLTYDGTSASGLSYTIFGTEEYNLPIQAAQIGMCWHEDYGYPFLMEYASDLDFYGSGNSIENDSTPIYFRLWGSDEVRTQPLQASVLRVYSSSSADTSIGITVYGTVSGYPDQETITTDASNGTTAVSGTKSFSTVERVVKASTTTGRITVDANSANTTVAVLPTGDQSRTIQYTKIQVWPLPTRAFNVNVQYYKEPWMMVNSGDIHELGQEFDEALILLATAKLKAEQNQDEAKTFFQLYENELMSLKRYNVDTIPNWMPKLQRPRQSRQLTGGKIHRNLRFSQLGGNYGPMGG